MVDDSEGRAARLGPMLRRAWVGYRLRLDAELDAAGFSGDHLPDARTLRICVRRERTTISDVGRELAITRQGAAKLVAALSAAGYVTLEPSPTDGREKLVRLTPRAHEYLAAHRSAVARIDAELREQLGDAPFDALTRLLDALGDGDQPPLHEYLRRRWSDG